MLANDCFACSRKPAFFGITSSSKRSAYRRGRKNVQNSRIFSTVGIRISAYNRASCGEASVRVSALLLRFDVHTWQSWVWAVGLVSVLMVSAGVEVLCCLVCSGDTVRRARYGSCIIWSGLLSCFFNFFERLWCRYRTMLSADRHFFSHAKPHRIVRRVYSKPARIGTVLVARLCLSGGKSFPPPNSRPGAVHTEALMCMWGRQVGACGGKKHLCARC